MSTNVFKERYKEIYLKDKNALYNYRINGKTIAQIAEDYNVDVDDLIDEFSENDDIIIARLRAKKKKLLGKEIVDLLTMGGNISPDNVYDTIKDAASTVIDFKYNKYRLINTITNCEDDESIALTTVDLAMLIVNIDSKYKEIYSDEDRVLLNEIYEIIKNCPVISGREAKEILGFVSARRLSVQDNTLLYNKIIESGYGNIGSLFSKDNGLFGELIIDDHDINKNNHTINDGGISR